MMMMKIMVNFKQKKRKRTAVGFLIEKQMQMIVIEQTSKNVQLSCCVEIGSADDDEEYTDEDGGDEDQKWFIEEHEMIMIDEFWCKSQ